MLEAIQELLDDNREWVENKSQEIGMDRLNQLNKNLLQSGRLDDLKHSVYDKSYQKKLLKEYGL